MKTIAVVLLCAAGFDQLPSWVKLGGEVRTRVEGRAGDAWGLVRTRLTIQLSPTSWLGVGFEGQDARAPGLPAGKPTTIFRNPADVRQAYVRLGRAEGPVRLTVGRQLLNYGAQRVLGPLDWTNTSRNWDAVKLELRGSRGKLDVFASSVVEPNDQRRLDMPRRGHNIHGVYGSVGTWAVVEPYLLYKTGGGSGVVSAGLRVASKPSLKQLDYQFETIRQYGRYQGLAHDAWAITALAGHTFRKVRVSGEFSGASGDRDANDRHHTTFDHLLGTNHLFYGLVDAVGWQNMRNVRIGLDGKPTRKLNFAADYHWLWLASASDALYDVAGRATVRPRAGNRARNIGTELDFTMNWTPNRHYKIGGGVGHLFAGSFLKHNSTGSSQTFPYLYAQYSF